METEVFTHPLPDGLVAFWAADDRPGSAVREAIEQVRQIRCGLVEQVRGLADLRVAAQAARALASLVEDTDQQALTMRNAGRGSPATASRKPASQWFPMWTPHWPKVDRSNERV